jgi:hypothetical protein
MAKKTPKMNKTTPAKTEPPRDNTERNVSYMGANLLSNVENIVNPSPTRNRHEHSLAENSAISMGGPVGHEDKMPHYSDPNHISPSEYKYR